MGFISSSPSAISSKTFRSMIESLSTFWAAVSSANYNKLYSFSSFSFKALMLIELTLDGSKLAVNKFSGTVLFVNVTPQL